MALKDTAVKQAVKYVGKPRLEKEGQFLQFFGHSRSPRIVRMYKKVYHVGKVILETLTIEERSSVCSWNIVLAVLCRPFLMDF